MLLPETDVMVTKHPYARTDRNRLTILHVVAPPEVGGQNQVAGGLAIGHRRRGHNVHVAAIVDADLLNHPWLASLAAEGVEVHFVRLPPRSYLRERRAIRALCEALHPDVVHTHADRPDVIDSPVARRLGIPTVTTIHGSSLLGGKTLIYEWFQRMTHRRFDAVVAVSRALATEARADGVTADRLHMIANAWTSGAGSVLSREVAKQDLGIDESGFIIGWVGRLIPVKGADVFLSALAHLRDIPFRAVLVGDGTERPALETLRAELQLEDRVHFAGYRGNAAPLFSAFDLFVLSSRSEGTPIVLFEAMAARLPVVATAVGGVPDVLPESMGWWAPPENPAALAEAMRAAMSDRSRATTRGLRAEERLREEYDGETWLSRYEDVYYGACARRSRQ